MLIQLKFVLPTVFAVLATTLSPVSLAADQAAGVETTAAQRNYNTSLIESLLAEGTPRALVLAATSLSYADGDRSTIDAQRHILLIQAARTAPDDAWVQWFAALYAEPSTTLSEPAKTLLRLEPDNGAAWLFQIQAAIRAEDSAGVTEALTRIGASREFDTYYVEFALEWLNFLKSHTELQAPGYDGQFLAEAGPLVMAIARAAALAIPNMAVPIQACKAKDQSLTADRREACLAAGRLMLDHSTTIVSTRIGATMLRLVDAPDAAEANRNADYLVEEYTAISIAAYEDPAQLNRIETEWVQTRNEVEVAKNVLLRAGMPLLPPAGWQTNPNRFMVNPASTDGG